MYEKSKASRPHGHHIVGLVGNTVRDNIESTRANHSAQTQRLLFSVKKAVHSLTLQLLSSKAHQASTTPSSVLGKHGDSLELGIIADVRHEIHRVDDCHRKISRVDVVTISHRRLLNLQEVATDQQSQRFSEVFS